MDTASYYNMALCRICLVKDVRMYSIVDTPLLDIYQNLTALPFNVDSTRPTTVCYICHSRLLNCYKLKLMCLQSERSFDLQFNNNKIQSNICMPRKQLTCHALINISNMPDTESNLVIVKKEPVDLTEEMKQEIVEEISHIAVGENTKKYFLSKINHEKIDEIFVENKQINKRYLIKTKSKVKKSKKKQLFKCDICHKSYSSKSSLKRHKVTHTIKKRDICENKNSSMHNSVEKPYVCEVCDKEFSMKGNLLTHIRTHSGERPYECDICEKSFTIEKNLKRHNRIHTGEKPYQCNVCKQSFAVKYTLNIHLRRKHTGERPFKCVYDLCNKSFYVKSEMLNHMATHKIKDQNKPNSEQYKFFIQQYKCDICNRFLSSKSILLRHMSTHSGEQQYQCQICNKYFGRNSDLMLHYRIHTGEKSYQCDMCKLCFTYKSNLRSHINRHHSKEI